jgi:hypothetical protein
VVEVTVQAQEADPTGRLAAWTEAQGIIPADSAEALADRVIASLGAWRVAEWLDKGGTDYLSATAARYANPAPLTDGQQAAEDYRHGHGPKPRRQGKRGNG